MRYAEFFARLLLCPEEEQISRLVQLKPFLGISYSQQFEHLRAHG